MPPLTRLFLKSAFLYLLLALVLGALLVLQGALALPAWVVALRPAYYHVLMLGWATQLIFGVIFWMFPKVDRENPRGNERLAWLAFWTLNAGLLLRLMLEPAHALGPNSLTGWGLALSALLQVAAGVSFAVAAWPRIKGK